MFAIGLMPSATGEPGGKPTGEFCPTTSSKVDVFSRVALLTDHELMWESTTQSAAEAPEEESNDPLDESRARNRPDQSSGSRNPRAKVKYSCPNKHKLNVWAKPGALIDCHLCSEEAGRTRALVSEFEIADENDRRKQRGFNITEDLAFERHD